MITPKIALSKLFALRERERAFHVVWGITRWFSLALTLVVIACFIDWRVDRARETPIWLRTGLLLVQIIVLAVAGWFWLLRPWSRGPALIPLARRVEEHFLEFDHRLITAIQLTRPEAQTHGMSAQLIENLTGETEAIAGKHRFVQLADTRRLRWSAILSLWPIALFAFALLFWGPKLWSILLERQLLSNVDIPRKHYLVNLTPRVFPAGDIVTVRYEVSGPIDETDGAELGFVRIDPEGKNSEDYPLEFERRVDANHTIFKAQVLQSSINFLHRAWLADGRTRTPSEVIFEPRPEVTIGPAVVEMPGYVPLKPNGTRYSTTYPFGDVKGFAGSLAYVQMWAQKPIKQANLILYQRDKNGREMLGQELAVPGPYPEIEVEGSKKYLIQMSFELVEGLSAYRAEVTDLNGFGNDLSKTPRRTIEIQPERPPVVTLLPERTLIGLEDDELPGIAPLGRPIPIGYTCRSPIGLAKLHETKKGNLQYPAQIVYRVNDGKWIFKDCIEVPETPQSGPYMPQEASFKNVAYQLEVLKNNVMFHAIAGDDPMKEIPRQYGGGRYDLQTDSLRKVKEDGKEAPLEAGDRVEYYVVVYDSNDKPGRSIDTRSVDLRTPAEFADLLIKSQQNENRLRELAKQQQGTFSIDKKKK